MRYEYIRIGVDIGDLTQLNDYGMNGWRVVGIFLSSMGPTAYPTHYALLERSIPGGYAPR